MGRDGKTRNGQNSRGDRRGAPSGRSAGLQANQLERIGRLQRENRDLRRRLRDARETIQEQSEVADLLEESAAIANEAESEDHAWAQSLERICARFGWAVGHAYLKDEEDDEGVYAGNRFWHVGADLEIDELRELTPCVKRGRGFLGETIVTGRSRWSRDLSDIMSAERARWLLSHGIQSVLALPIPVEKEIAGVLEFFAAEAGPPASSLLEGLRHFGTQLGQIVERKSLARQLAQRSVQEQRRIAQELHDTIGQQLSGISMLVEAMAKMVAHDRTPSQAYVREIALAVQETKNDVRRLSRGLHPVRIRSDGLADAVEDLLEDLSEIYPAEWEFACPAPVSLPDPETATFLYLIIREMLQNALEHSGTERIEVRLSEDTVRQVVEATVQDFGKGLDGAREGTGFKIMRYRADRIGAEIEVESAPGEGARVICRWFRGSIRDRSRP